MAKSGIFQCDVPGCRHKPFSKESNFRRHQAAKHGAGPMMPVHAKFCWNCGVPQPTEIPLSRR